MNIFEEIAESYTYNGSVSLKAMEDDIVTLENQIDSYNATLREINLRGKKSAPLVEKIRDTKIKLSLLRAAYKRESDKSTPNDAILNMLGVSGKEAVGVESVKTAAADKTPLKQNFESAEFDNVSEEKTDCVSVQNEKVDELSDNEVVTDKYVSSDEVIMSDKNVAEEDLNELYSCITSEDEVIVTNPNETEIVMNENGYEVDYKATVSEGDENNTVTETPKFEDTNENTESTVTKTEAIKNLETKLANTEELKKNKEIKAVKKEKVKPEKENETVKYENLSENTFEIVPPPTIDDYMEVESSSKETEFPYDECNLTGYVDVKMPVAPDYEAYEIPLSEKIEQCCQDEVVAEEDKEVCVDGAVFDAFYPDNKIYASFDLCPYTNMVNTNSITGSFNYKEKTLELDFTDARDYELLLFFIKELNEKKKWAFFDRFRKNTRNIIMYVRTELDGVNREYRYEFTGCRIIDIFDSSYKSMRESTYYGTTTHEFFAKFKYNDFKIAGLNATTNTGKKRNKENNGQEII